jgi:hypothetical protein
MPGQKNRISTMPDSKDPHQRLRRVASMETLGLLVVAVILVLVLLWRWAGDITWGAR